MKISILFLFSTLTICSFAQDTAAIRFSKLVDKNDLQRHLNILASDEYEGRATGEKGQKMAAEYISAHFKKAGIPPYKENTYYQTFPLKFKDPAKIIFSVNNSPLEMVKDYYFLPFSLPSGIVRANEVVFAGYGIAEKKYNDFSSVDVKDKLVMVNNGEPKNKKGKNLLSGDEEKSEWSDYKKKVEHLKAAGAKGAIIIVERKTAERFLHFITASKLELDKGEKDEEQKETFPVAFIYKETAEKILGNQVNDALGTIELKGKPASFVKQVPVIIDATNYSGTVTGENVLGYVEGSDLKNEVIIITAHYDHIGKDGKEVYNGADDDGSGTVAVMELAEAFAKAKAEGKGPRRSILFMPVSGEEKGLLGSEYYTDHPVYPLENTVCNLNIDMIGRTDTLARPAEVGDKYVYVIGSDKISTDLHKINEEANKKYVNLQLDYRYNDLKDPNRFYYRSDHYNFAKNNIPVIFYFNGTHKDYHQESDEVDKINFDLLEMRSKLVFFTAWELANRTERIKIDVIEKK